MRWEEVKIWKMTIDLLKGGQVWCSRFFNKSLVLWTHSLFYWVLKRREFSKMFWSANFSLRNEACNVWSEVNKMLLRLRKYLKKPKSKQTLSIAISSTKTYFPNFWKWLQIETNCILSEDIDNCLHSEENVPPFVGQINECVE